MYNLAPALSVEEEEVLKVWIPTPSLGAATGQAVQLQYTDFVSLCTEVFTALSTLHCTALHCSLSTALHCPLYCSVYCPLH